MIEVSDVDTPRPSSTTPSRSSRGGSTLSAHAMPFIPAALKKTTREIGCQTFSTGEIRITEVYYEK